MVEKKDDEEIVSKEVKVKEHKDEVFVDFEGTAQSNAPKKVLVEEDSYFAEVTSVESIKAASYDNKSVLVDKLVFSMALEGEGSDGAELAMFVNPIIKKSSGTAGYSNSKLYDLLDKAGEMDNAKAKGDELKSLVGLVEFLQLAFMGRKCKVLVKTTNKGKENQYSSVGNVIRFEAKAKEES